MKVSFFVSSRNEQETLIHINKFPLDASHDHDHYRDYCTHPFLHLHKLCVMTAFTWSTSFIRLKNQSISTVYDQRTSQSVYLNLFNSILLFYQNHNYEWYKSYKLHELFTYSVYTNSLEEHIYIIIFMKNRQSQIPGTLVMNRYKGF